MGESYIEQMVKQKTTLPTMIRKATYIVLIVVGVMFSMLYIAAFPLLFGLIALIVWLWKRTSLEFEYLYYSGDIDIDMIMGMQKRKRVLSTNVKSIEVLAPTGSPELYRYQDLKVIDCSSNTENPTYEMVVVVKGQKIRVKFEPNQKILEGLKMYEPRKVFLK